MCKLEGFTYAPSEGVYWIHGNGAETAFLYVTTQSMSKEMPTKLSDEAEEAAPAKPRRKFGKGNPDQGWLFDEGGGE